MLMTGKEYLDSIRDGRRVYVGGEWSKMSPPIQRSAMPRDPSP